MVEKRIGPGYCTHCEQEVDDLIQELDPIYGKYVAEEWCEECQDNYDGPGDDYYESLAEDIAAKKERKWRELKDAGRIR